MATVLPEEMHQEARPPVATHVAPPSGRVGRPSMFVRPLITPVALTRAAPFGAPGNGRQFDVRHLYVRRFWTALLGPAAITDLLRLAQAAKEGKRLRLPHTMAILLTEGLAARLTETRFGVASSVKELHPHQLERLPPALRREAGGYSS